MITINPDTTLNDLSQIKRRLSQLALLQVDGYFLQKMREAFEHRVFFLLRGSRDQKIGIEPTPMYETGQLGQEFYISSYGIEMPAHGFWIEGLHTGQDIWGVPLAALLDQLYSAETRRRGPIFGPIWDITENEAVEFEEQSLRFFYM